jgi:hypothetical protein
MHEAYREYLDRNSRRFLIIVFKDEKAYLLKIFLHRAALHQFRFDTPKADITIEAEAPAKPFEKFVQSAREWIVANY